MGDASERNGGNFGDTGVIELTGKIMVVAIVLLFFVVVFVFCLHLYAKWFWYRRQDSSSAAATTRRRRHLEFAAGHHEAPVVPTLRRGLDPSLLKTIPVIMFDPKEFKDGLECAVCLCELCEGEKARLLPKCNHGFHVDCIDMWFQSHSTCPLCRNPIANSTNSSNSASDPSLENVLQSPIGENPNAVVIEIPNFPTNVLIWGNETQVSTFGPCVEEGHQGNAAAAAETSTSSSSSSSSMASTSSRPEVDIPRQISEEDEQKSAVPTRLRSLKRLLSGNRRVNPSSPRNLDLEQGVRGLS